MLHLQINERKVEEIFHEELKRRLDEIQHRQTFWDMKELIRQTSMSEPYIREHFFHDDRFPKYRVGTKWYFPARETESFLITWLKEQSKY
ncbi:hypothetical protein BEP19_16030 [Ammoniphilus oxalaticus]|uniref:Group-specific protein n=1 Tax=Ammoniphilus oxalaticus TaxID=66863 RepID=A0A419SQH6_9BACL|nr:hypothetical protein [Ammoniphilus oxalaticus]RKD26711.1 hypothetical protein BEP19_16030 [Ammoniphilus oxalaticus]